jgi:high-affinity iron transporter
MGGHGREIAQKMKAMGHAVASGRKSLLAMGVVVPIAVLCEGADVVLSLYGIAVSSIEGLIPLHVGGALGVGRYRGLLATPLPRLFSVTSWLIALLAAGMAGRAAAVLPGADLISAWGYQLWDTSWVLSQDRLAVHALRALIGYSDRPMGAHLAAYVITLASLLIGARFALGNRLDSASPAPARSAAQHRPF